MIIPPPSLKWGEGSNVESCAPLPPSLTGCHIATQWGNYTVALLCIGSYVATCNICGWPYVGMALKKMTLRVHKWHAWNVCVRLVKGLHGPYRVLPWATGLLTSLKSITKVSDRQVTKTDNSFIFWLLSSSFVLSQASTIAAEAITTIQMWKTYI